MAKENSNRDAILAFIAGVAVAVIYQNVKNGMDAKGKDVKISPNAPGQVVTETHL